MIHIDIITLFPDDVYNMINFSISGRAIDLGLVSINCVNPRDFASNRHATVDDRPYGGGPGMVMMVEPLKRALQSVTETSDKQTVVSHLSPQGQVLTHEKVRQMTEREHIVLICGRYEGIDERFVEQYVDEEISIGDFVISGGELAAAVVVDAVIRLIPGALGKAESAEQDSFANGLLDCPHFTRPEQLPEGNVPAVLLSGDHGAIEQWRRKQSLGNTWLKRPELIDIDQLEAGDRILLEEFINDHQSDDPQN